MITNKIICGDWVKVAETLPSGLAHLIITSPPYWGQRNYQTEGQLGLEKTPEEHIEKLVIGFRELRRVLRDDGVLFLNYGDKYASCKSRYSQREQTIQGKARDNVFIGNKADFYKTGAYKDGDLIGLAWRLALALQADGWYLRSDIIWAKALSFCEKYSGSTMPESVNGWRWERHKIKVKAEPKSRTAAGAIEGMRKHSGYEIKEAAQWQDCPGCPKCEPNDGLVLRRGSWRPTRAHEYLFLLTKGNWKSRVVKLANFNGERFIFGQNICSSMAKASFLWPPTCLDDSALVQIAVCLASTIFDGTQRQQNFSLPPFYAKKWKENFCDNSSFFIGNTPSKLWPAIWSSRFLSGDITSKQFLQELKSLFITLLNSDNFTVILDLIRFATSPQITADRKGTITIHYPGQICKFDFIHDTIISQTPGESNYYCDMEAVREENSPGCHSKGTALSPPIDSAGIGHKDWSKYTPDLIAGRNLRDVWCINPQAYPDAHYATFPEKLVEPCIKVGTSQKGCCPKCGAQWARIVDTSYIPAGGKGKEKYAENTPKDNTNPGPQGMRFGRANKDTTTLGWLPTCKCGIKETVPAIVYDPFMGSGTVAAVAARLGRNYLGSELNEDYVKNQAEYRVAEGETGITKAEQRQGQMALFEKEKPNADR